MPATLYVGWVGPSKLCKRFFNYGGIKCDQMLLIMLMENEDEQEKIKCLHLSCLTYFGVQLVSSLALETLQVYIGRLTYKYEDIWLIIPSSLKDHVSLEQMQPWAIFWPPQLHQQTVLCFCCWSWWLLTFQGIYVVICFVLHSASQTFKQKLSQQLKLGQSAPKPILLMVM